MSEHKNRSAKPRFREAGTPGPEIDITPEMIEAGALALSEYTSAFDTLEDGAETIYRRMEAARPRSGEE